MSDAQRGPQTAVIFRQFCTRDEDVSYLLADPVSRYAALVDPHVDAEGSYQEVLSRLDLSLVYLFETHAHESHQSAAPVLRAATGARLVTQSSVDVACVDLHVDDGETVYVGEEILSVIETPGHSACSMCLRWRDRVFTGHTLLAGVTGSCTRGDADAGRLFDSVRDGLFMLPDETVVYPGRLVDGRRISSIAQERAINADLRPHTSREQFVRCKQREARGGERREGWYLAANRRCDGGV